MYHNDALTKYFDEMFSECFQNTGLDYNLYKNEDNLKLEISLPGFKKENVSVVFKNKVLTISAKREKVKDSPEVLIWCGFKTQDICKEIRFEKDYKDVKGKYVDGVLVIEMISEETKILNVTIE